MKYTLKHECRVIAREMERRFEVPPGSVFEEGRASKRACRCRWATWAMIRALHPNVSYSHLGDLFKRDHSSIINGLSRYLGGKCGSAKKGDAALIARGERVLTEYLRREGLAILMRSYAARRSLQPQDAPRHALAA